MDRHILHAESADEYTEADQQKREHRTQKQTPAAIITKLSDALGNEKTPVTMAAIANLKATRPEASFISDSPSRIRCILFGKCTRPASALTATASVGDRIAASAKDAASGIEGIIQ